METFYIRNTSYSKDDRKQNDQKMTVYDSVQTDTQLTHFSMFIESILVLVLFVYIISCDCFTMLHFDLILFGLTVIKIFYASRYFFRIHQLSIL